MTEPGTDYERWRRAEQELGARAEEVVRPIEETDEVAEAVEDEAPVTGLDELAEQGRRGAAEAQKAPAGHDGDAAAQEAPAGHDEEAEAQEAPAGHDGEAEAHEAPAGHDGEAEAHEAPAGHDGEAEPTERVSPEQLAGRDENGRGGAAQRKDVSGRQGGRRAG